MPPIAPPQGQDGSAWEPPAADSRLAKTADALDSEGQPLEGPALRAAPMIRGAAGEKVAEGGKRNPRHSLIVKTWPMAARVRRSTWHPPIKRGQMRSAACW